MSTRRRILFAAVIPAALLVGPVAGTAGADTPAPGPTAGAVSEAPGTVTFAATAAGLAPIKKVEVDLPTGTPLRDVTVPTVAGWTSSTTSAALPSCGDQVVSSVTWTATGDGIAPQGMGSFAIQVGSFPKTDEMDFNGVVTYADGRSMPWTQAEGVQLAGSAIKMPSSGAASPVTVSAASTTSAAAQPAVATPAQPAVAPVAQPNSFMTWVNSFVKMMVSVW